MVETLYHITSSANVSSIAARGILPVGQLDKDCDGLTRSLTINAEPWRKDTVWLTHDPHAVYNQMCFMTDFVVLEIDAIDLQYTIRDKYRNYADEPIEYLVTGSIDPELIVTVQPCEEWIKENVH